MPNQFQPNYEQLSQQFGSPNPDTAANFVPTNYGTPAQQTTTPTPNYVMQTSMTGKQVDPLTQALAGQSFLKQEQATQMGMKAVEEETKAQQNVNDLMAQQAALVAEENANQAAEYLQKQNAYHEATKQTEQKIATAEADFKNAKIDGMRVFNSSNSNKIIGAVSLALGAMGSAFTGQKNYALDIINSVIDRDIEEQKYEANKKYTTFENAKKERELLDAHFTDDVSRMQFASKIRTDAVIKTIDSYIMAAKNPLIKATGEKLIADMKQQSAANTATMYQLAMQAAPTVTTTATTPTGGVGQLSKQDYDEHLTFSQAKKSVDSLFDRGAKITFIEGSTPSAIGGKRGEAENISSAMGAVLAEQLKQRSDADWTNIVKPLTPRPGDTPETLKFKKESLNSLLNGYAPAGYLKIENARKPYQASTFQKK